MGSKGKNNKSFTLWEELELRVSTDAGKVAIYKKTHNEIIKSLSKDNEIINIDANDQIDSISNKIIEKLGLN